MNFFYLSSLASGTLLGNTIDAAYALLVDRKSIRYMEIYNSWRSPCDSFGLSELKIPNFRNFGILSSLNPFYKLFLPRRLS